MEFHYHCTGDAPDLPAIGRAIFDLDPAALLDLEPAGRTLRIATTLGGGDLLGCLRRAGMRVVAEELEQQPSVCCGGCSG